MRKLLIALALALLTSCALVGTAYAGGGGSKSPSTPPAPPPPPTPQAPSDPNTANAVARERTRRAQGGGNAATLLTGNEGDTLGESDLSKPKLGGNTLLGG